MPDAKRLKDKVAILTGASKGIGKEIALTFGREGAKLVLCARNEAALKETASLVVAAGGCEPLLFALDVTDAAKVEEMTDKTLDKYSRIDILVNNAGITRDGLLLRMSDQDWDDVLDTNLKGTFICMRAVAKPMMRQRQGRIINMASVIGLVGNAGQANYAASKAGIIALTKSAAKEFGSRNILINAIAPGFIETEMTDVLGEDIKKAILNQIPVKSFGKTSDVAKAAVYLASDDSSFITGQVITVDGGMTM